MIKSNRKEIIKHSIIWILLTIFFCIIDPVIGSFAIQLTGTFLIMVAYMFSYYSLFLFTFPKFHGINYLKLFLFITLIFFCYLIISFINFFFVLKVFDGVTSLDSIFDWIFTEFILFAIISAIAFGSYQNKISLNEIRTQNEKEKALLIKELGFFKNQFNSHITFNFLNYCYSHVLQNSKEAAEVIESYSEMLRFTINTKPDEMVLLEKEVLYIKQFISLKKQLSKGICVEFNTEGNLIDKFILPRIFIALVENAFKHGETHCMDAPIEIKIKSTVVKVILEVSNKKNKHKTKPESTGVGQQNLKNQLELFYKTKYELEINENYNSYYCKLSLNH